MSTSGRDTRRARWALLATTTALVGAAVVLWHWSPLADLATPDRLAVRFGHLRSSPWAPLAVIAIYVLAGLIEFPVVILIALTAMLFEPAIAFAVSLAGALASALVFHLIGARLGRRTMEAALGGAFERMRVALARRGIVAIVAIRSVPFAPFTVVNLAAGALGAPLRDYMLGTALGLLPGIALLTAFGDRLRRLWQNPTAENVVVLCAIAFAWIGAVLVLQRAAAGVPREAQQPISNSSDVPGSAGDRRGRR